MESIKLVYVGEHWEEVIKFVFPGEVSSDTILNKLRLLAVDYNTDLEVVRNKHNELYEAMDFHSMTPENVFGKSMMDEGGRFPAGVDPKKHDPVLWKRRKIARAYNGHLQHKLNEYRKSKTDLLSEQMAPFIDQLKNKHELMYNKFFSDYYSSAPLDFRIEKKNILHIDSL